MPVTKKSAIEDKKKQAELASENQMQDLMAAISGLGSGNSTDSNSFEIKTENESSVGEDFKTVTNSTDDKPGYVSLVIPNSLKKKWKLYSTQHSMSLTDCLKLGMKLLEEMEQQGKIKIEDGFVTLNA
ncbi:MAG: hypothetical protein K5786_03275 [Treponema sp.]|nr:hypothetical protein [Treponema sp.]